LLYILSDILFVSEIFESIQGEGPFLGTPSLFLRLAFCNLKCVWCDTEYTWKGDIRYEKMDLKKLEDKIKSYNLKHLVITGGEPLLWQRKFYPLVENLLAENFIIEVETNGTVKSELPEEIYFNVSPKLSNSGENFKKRIKIDILRNFNRRERAIFKFVIQKREDINEVLEIKDRVGIENRKIYLMPEGKTKEELERKRKMVFELSKKYGLRFSDRLHILMGVK